LSIWFASPETDPIVDKTLRIAVIGLSNPSAPRDFISPKFYLSNAVTVLTGYLSIVIPTLRDQKLIPFDAVD